MSSPFESYDDLEDADERLQAADPAERRVAIIALGHSGDSAAVGHLARMVSDPDAGVRQQVAMALGEFDGPDAADALARLLVRRGDEQEAADALGSLVRASHDDEAITEAGRLALDLADLRGRLPELEVELADAVAVGQDTPARRKLLAALLKRLLPPMYGDATADEARAALGRSVLRPLLEIITETDQPPDRAVIDLIGMLGNGDAAPALVRLAIREKEAPLVARTARVTGASGAEMEAEMLRAARSVSNAAATVDVQLAALAALARLGDARGRPAFVRFAPANTDRRFRALAIWGLGRLPENAAAPELLKALDDRQSDVVAAARLLLVDPTDPKPPGQLGTQDPGGHRAVLQRCGIVVQLHQWPEFCPQVGRQVTQQPRHLSNRPIAEHPVPGARLLQAIAMSRKYGQRVRCMMLPASVAMLRSCPDAASRSDWLTTG